MKEKTIAAIATAMSPSGIGIIRLSGEDAFIIIKKIFRPYKKEKDMDKQKGYTLHYGFIYDEDQLIDEVLVSVMRAPHSYTAENTVEINCHGGVFVLKKVLELAIKNGAYPAEPGEFTKRAFLNGRIDLSQAESVIDIINSKNSLALKNSVYNLKGNLSEKIKKLRETLIYHIAFMEAALDDPEHYSLDNYSEELLPVISETSKEVKKLISSADNGRILTEGIKTVILGRPNAGKSSLLNMLAGEERAIVTNIEGTTRDILEENITLQGIHLNIIDTAGIRQTEDLIEKIGVDKALKEADEADLILFVIDSSAGLNENDSKIITLIENKKAIVILNKVDLKMKITKQKITSLLNIPVIEFSTKEDKGMDELIEQINKMFYQGELSFNDEIYITSIRQKMCLTEAENSLELVKNSILDGLPEDFYSMDMMNAYEHLGKIIGETVEDDLVNEIFLRFCMGK